MSPRQQHVRLRVGIAVVFLAVVLPLTMLMVGILYQQNAHLARQMAVQSMNLAARQATVAVTGLINELSNAVEISAAFGRARQEALRSPETVRPLFEELGRLPAVYSLYFALHDNGDFFQAVRLPRGQTSFGPHRAAPPPDANWVIRTIESGSGERRDTYMYLSDWGKVVRVERGDPTYDPRTRPWYEAAMPADKVASSDVYVFSGTGKPGLTLSRRLVTENGVRLGVFAADLSVVALADFLKAHRVGKTGITFILDEQGRLIGYPNPDKSVRQQDGKAILIRGDDVDDPAVAAAVKVFQSGGGESFPLEAQGVPWLAHFMPFPAEFGHKWTIGVVVAEDDFVAPLKQASLIILGVGLAFVLLATAGIVTASRLLIQPIHRLIRETELIREFRLDGPVDVKSPVLEIDKLAAAVGNMKAGLASFGTYVPKSLVHDIIRSGAGTGVGGERRPLTVMFTDLQGFTQASERMEPEQVLQWLSGYFERMSGAIHEHGGTIDKYIGDAVMAMWNAPVEDPDHVANACRAMLACRQAARVLGEGQAGGPRLRTRMGLHTGTAMVGNVGSSDRMQYTALGGMVNLASRVEGLNKVFGTELLVTDSVATAVEGRFLLRPFGPVTVAGASIPQAVFELVGEVDEARPGLDQWLQAFDAWQRGDWLAARDGFLAYQAACPRDKATGMYLNIAVRYAEHGAPSGWDGVLRFTSK